jgi:thymidylate synthase (FAD)
MKTQVLNNAVIELLSNTCNGDLLVVNAARCSFDKQHEIFDDTKDKKLINYLAKHEHVLPFRHPSATLRITCPIFVLRQLGKHQVGFSWSEVSRRYISSEPEFYFPEPNDWREAAPEIKQGSLVAGLPRPEAEAADELVDNLYMDAAHAYDELLDIGVCPEQARMVLPQSMMTTTVVTGSLLAWFHLYKLRTEEHTQRETQEYAKAIGDILSELFPHSWEALCEHSL